MTRRPDFLIVGAMKCGTSTLHEQLAAQPGLFLSTPKEPNFFSDDPIFAKGLEWYEALFADATADDLCGESSTHYTKLPTYPDTVARMQSALNAPRLIYIIRDPVQRALSHYIHAWTERSATADVGASFAADPTFVEYGRYAMQIRPYADWVGRENILLLSLEEMKANPQDVLERTAAHIGLDQPVTWQDTVETQNVSGARARRLPFQSLLIDNPIAQILRRALVPKTIRTRIREGRQMQTRPNLPDALVEDLQATFLADRADLAEMFPGAAALDRAYPFAEDR